MKPLWIIYNNICMMITKYHGNKVENMITEKEFYNMMNDIEHVVIRTNTKRLYVLLHHNNEANKKVAMLDTFIRSAVVPHKPEEVVIIAKKEESQHVKNAIKAREETFGLTIRFWKTKIFLCELPKAVCCTPCQILTDAEAMKLEEYYRIRKTQLPKIQHNDPMAIWSNCSKGQILKTSVPNEATLDMEYYRLVV